jgi:glycosyltransferase involved in cell wall biosynthesis
MKVLIIGQNFFDGAGSGVTLGNLFSAFDKNEIYLANTNDFYDDKDMEKANSIYILGNKEYKVVFPFNIFLKNTDSQILTSIKENKTKNISSKNKNTQRFFHKLISVFRYIGLYNFLRKLKLSSEFLNWFDHIKPDIVYTQLGSLYVMNFIKELISTRNFKLVIHIMDDWPNFLQGKMFYKELIRKNIDKNFRTILKHADLKLSISNLMSMEYNKRYGEEWFTFHNCIPDRNQNVELRTSRTIGKSMNIMYFGKIGHSNRNTINTFIRVIENYSKDDFKFHIYSTDYSIFKRKKFKNTNVHKAVEYKTALIKMSSADLLLLPFDFNAQNKKYVKYSMPTKMPEYMSSGTPTFIIAPKECALSKYASDNNIAIICYDDNVRLITEKLKQIKENYNSLQEMAKYAQEIAFRDFSVNKQAPLFKRTISSLLES